jgi:Metallo-peptidase family M12
MITRRRTICFIVSSLLFSTCSLSGPVAPQRVVRVKVVADSRFRAMDPRWQQGARGLIEAADDYFDREFGIRFVPENIEPWAGAENNSLTAAMLSQLKRDYRLKDEKGSYDLIVGLTTGPVDLYAGRSRVDRIGNCQQGLANYMVIYVSTPFRYQGSSTEPSLDVVGLLHELGHIFGAEHVQDRDSIMYEDFEYRSDFDNKNREIILKNKFCPFGKG